MVVMILEQLVYLSEKLACVLKVSSEDCLYDGLEVLLTLTFFQPLNLRSNLERKYMHNAVIKNEEIKKKINVYIIYGELILKRKTTREGRGLSV